MVINHFITILPIWHLYSKYQQDHITYPGTLWVYHIHQWKPIYMQIGSFNMEHEVNSYYSRRDVVIECISYTVYPKKYAHGFCYAVLCCGYTLTDFPISIRLTSLALWQSNDCPSASKATLMNMDKYFMWIHYERLHNHNKAKHNKTVCIFLGIYCSSKSHKICLWFCSILFCLCECITILWKTQVISLILQGYFTGTGIWLPQCHWSNPEGYG